MYINTLMVFLLLLTVCLLITFFPTREEPFELNPDFDETFYVVQHFEDNQWINVYRSSDLLEAEYAFAYFRNHKKHKRPVRLVSVKNANVESVIEVTS